MATIFVFTISLIILMRYLLIMSGMYKGPILRNFEQYGDMEKPYFPLAEMLFFFGLIVISGGALLQKAVVYDIYSTPLGIIILFSALLVTYLKHFGATSTAQTVTEALPTLPGWYARLENVTSRNERRRIAYLWLRLPFRTRMLYNVNDRFFFIWAELVIVSIIDEAEGA